MDSDFTIAEMSSGDIQEEWFNCIIDTMKKDETDSSFKKSNTARTNSPVMMERPLTIEEEWWNCILEYLENEKWFGEKINE